MKLAVTVWGNRISPVFDSARTLLIAELAGNKISGPYYAALDPGTPDDLIRILKKNNVTMLVCGAISKTSADLITGQQIRLISFVTGNVRQFLDCFAQDRTVGTEHMMPGFKHRSLNAY